MATFDDDLLLLDCLDEAIRLAKGMTNLIQTAIFKAREAVAEHAGPLALQEIRRPKARLQ